MHVSLAHNINLSDTILNIGDKGMEHRDGGSIGVEPLTHGNLFYDCLVNGSICIIAMVGLDFFKVIHLITVIMHRYLSKHKHYKYKI